MAMRKKGAKVRTMAKGAKSPLKPILLWGTLRPRKVEPSIRITEIVWDNGGWNIPSPPSVVDVPVRDVVEAGENLDALSEFKTIQTNLKALMADITSRFPIGVSVRSTAQLKGTKVIKEILRGGFKNIYETKEGGGTTDPTIRRQTEAANFGWSDGFSRKMRADDRPKYGMLVNGYKLKDKIAFYKQMGMTKKEIAEAVAKMPQPNEAGVVEYGDAMYGRNFITLKKDRVDATFTVGDSMDNLLQKPATRLRGCPNHPLRRLLPEASWSRC